MAAALPYLPMYKNVALLFQKIASAKQPEAFNQPFLSNVLGLKSTNDRALIPLLRALGFIDAAGKPTSEYSSLKNGSKAGVAIAEAIKRAYKPLFDANEDANALPLGELRGLIAQVAGTDDDMTSRILGTFNALLKVADFSATKRTESKGEEEDEEEEERDESEDRKEKSTKKPALSQTPFRPEFHYNIQVHLPSNATEDVYLSIFNALRRAFQ